MSQENRDPEIKVTDRRRFSPDGEPLEEAETAAARATPPQPEQAAEPAPAYAPPPLPPASFELLVLSLRWQIEMQLGLDQPRDADERDRDLDGARHTIDLLGVLQQKTRGNLSLEEQRLLDNSLTELRFRYVQAVELARNKP